MTEHRQAGSREFEGFDSARRGLLQALHVLRWLQCGLFIQYTIHWQLAARSWPLPFTALFSSISSPSLPCLL